MSRDEGAYEKIELPANPTPAQKLYGATELSGLDMQALHNAEDFPHVDREQNTKLVREGLRDAGLDINEAQVLINAMARGASRGEIGRKEYAATERASVEYLKHRFGDKWPQALADAKAFAKKHGLDRRLSRGGAGSQRAVIEILVDASRRSKR